MSVGYGTDISAIPDLSFNLKTGSAVVVEALARRLTTQRGSLFYALDYGIDVRDLQLAKIDSQILFQWKTNIEHECRRDDRVDDVIAHLTFDASTGILVLEIEVALLDGETVNFKLTVDASSVTLDLLDVG
jgi:hypothetical protein